MNFNNEEVNIESLIGKYCNGTLADDERRELNTWIEQSKENKLMFNQIREILLVSRLNDEHFQFDVPAALDRVRKKIRLRQPIPRFRNPKPRRVITISYRWAAVAAILLIIGGTLLNQWIRQPSVLPIAYQEINVPYGARSKILLPDGSTITLNAGTTLRYGNSFGKSNRDLWLDGEAYFVVNKSTTPFVVHAGTVQIKALGTQFNVRAYSSENNIETTLVEGKVAISDSNAPEPNKEVTLLPNQKLIVAKDGTPEKMETSNPANENKIVAQPALISIQKIEKQENIDPLPDISWKDNEWVIYRESLENLAIKLERRFDVKISFQEESLKTLRYNGTLPDESLEQVLNIIALVSPIKYSVKGKSVVFSKKTQLNVIK